jgi:hypothetical protein
MGSGSRGFSCAYRLAPQSFFSPQVGAGAQQVTGTFLQTTRGTQRVLTQDTFRGTQRLTVTILVQQTRRQTV